MTANNISLPALMVKRSKSLFYSNRKALCTYGESFGGMNTADLEIGECCDNEIRYTENL